MNVSEQIIEVLNDLCEKFGLAIDWSAENLWPKVEALCIKYINYEIVTSIFWIALILGITGLLWLVTGILWKKELKRDRCYRWDPDDSQSILTVVMICCSAIFSFISLIVVGIQIYDIIEAKVFPEKTIYEFISSKLAMLKDNI